MKSRISKRLLALLLVMMMVVSLIPISASAETIPGTVTGNYTRKYGIKYTVRATSTGSNIYQRSGGKLEGYNGTSIYVTQEPFDNGPPPGSGWTLVSSTYTGQTLSVDHSPASSYGEGQYTGSYPGTGSVTMTDFTAGSYSITSTDVNSGASTVIAGGVVEFHSGFVSATFQSATDFSQKATFITGANNAYGTSSWTPGAGEKNVSYVTYEEVWQQIGSDTYQAPKITANSYTKNIGEAVVGDYEGVTASCLKHGALTAGADPGFWISNDANVVPRSGGVYTGIGVQTQSYTARDHENDTGSGSRTITVKTNAAPNIIAMFANGQLAPDGTTDGSYEYKIASPALINGWTNKNIDVIVSSTLTGSYFTTVLRNGTATAYGASHTLPATDTLTSDSSATGYSMTGKLVDNSKTVDLSGTAGPLMVKIDKTPPSPNATIVQNPTSKIITDITDTSTDALSGPFNAPGGWTGFNGETKYALAPNGSSIASFTATAWMTKAELMAKGPQGQDALGDDFVQDATYHLFVWSWDNAGNDAQAQTAATVKGIGDLIGNPDKGIDPTNPEQPDDKPDNEQILFYFSSDDTSKGTIDPSNLPADKKFGHANTPTSTKDIPANDYVWNIDSSGKVWMFFNKMSYDAIFELDIIPNVSAKTGNAFDYWEGSFNGGAPSPIIGDPTDKTTPLMDYTYENHGSVVEWVAYFDEDILNSGEDPEGNEIPVDPENPDGPDGIPDKYQALFTFKVDPTGHGTLDYKGGYYPQVKLVRNKYTAGVISQTGTATLAVADVPVPTPAIGKAFMHWYDDTAATALKVGDKKAPAGDYTANNVFTAVFGIDELGGTDPNTDPDKPGGPDGIPDVYQVIFKFSPEHNTFGTLTIKDFTPNTTDEDPNNNNNGVKIGDNVYVVKTRVDATGAFTTNTSTKVTLTDVDVPAVAGNAALKKAFVWWIDDTNAPGAIEGMGIGDTVAPAGDYTARNEFIAKFADDIIGPNDPFNPEIPDGVADIFQVLFKFQMDASLLDEYYTFGGPTDGMPYYVVKTRYADLAQTKYSTTANVKLEETDVPSIGVSFADGNQYSVFDYWQITEAKSDLLGHVLNENLTPNERKSPATERAAYGTENTDIVHSYTITAFGTPDNIGVKFPWISPLPDSPYLLPDGIADKYQILFTFNVDANGHLVPNSRTATNFNEDTEPLMWVGTKYDSQGKLVVNKAACDTIVVNLPANVIPGVDANTNWAFDYWNDDTKPETLTIGDLTAPAGNYLGEWDATLGYYVQDFTALMAEDIHGDPEDGDDPDPDPDDVPDKYQTAFYFHAGANGKISLGSLTNCDTIIVYATKFDSSGNPALDGTATLRADQIPTGTGDIVPKGSYIFDHWHDDETSTHLTDEYPDAPISPSLTTYTDETEYHFTVIWGSDIVGKPEDPSDPTTGGGDGIPDKFQEQIKYTVDQLAHGNLTLGTLANRETIITYATFYDTDGVTLKKTGRATIDPDDVPTINNNTGFAFDLWNSSLNGPLDAGKRKAPANQTAPFPMNTNLEFTAQFDVDEVGKPEDGEDPDPDPDGVPDKYQIPMTFKHGDHGKLTLGTLQNKNTIIVYITRYDSSGLWSVNGTATLAPADVPSVKADKNYAFANWYNETTTTALADDDLKAPAGTYNSANTFKVEYDEDIVGLPEDPSNPNSGGGDGILDKYQEAVTYTTDGNGKLTLVTTAVNSDGVTVNINFTNKNSIVTYATFRDGGGNLSLTGTATIDPSQVPTPRANINYAFDLWRDGANPLTIGKVDAPADVAPFTKGTNKEFEATFADDVKGDPEEPGNPTPKPDDIPDKYQIPITFSGGTDGKLTLGTLINKPAIVVYITRFDSSGNWSATGDAELTAADIPNVIPNTNFAFANWYNDTDNVALADDDLKAPAGTYNAPKDFTAQYDEDKVGKPEDPSDPSTGGSDGILDKYQEAITYTTDGNGKLTLGTLQNRNSIITYATFRDAGGVVDVNGTATIDAADVPTPVASTNYAFDFWAQGATPMTLGKVDAPADVAPFSKGANKAFEANFDEDYKGQPEDPDDPQPRPDDIPDKYQEGIIFRSGDANEGLLSLGTLNNRARIRAYVTFRDASGNYDKTGTATINESIVPAPRAKAGFAFDIWVNNDAQSGDPTFVPLDRTAPKDVAAFSAFDPNERTFTANFDVDEKGDPEDPDDPDPDPDDIPDKYQVAISFNGGSGKLTLGNLQNRNNIRVYVNKLDGLGNYSETGTATLTDDLIPDVIPGLDLAFLNWVDITAGNADLPRGDLKSPAGTYTQDNAFTVKYAEDKVGQPEDPDDPVPGPDGIPDMYQESIIFKTDDAATGLLTLGSLVDKERIRTYVTFKDALGEFDENGKATIDEASIPEPSSKIGYAFDIWNNDLPQSGDVAFDPLDRVAPKTVAPFDALGDDVRTFTAFFDEDVKGDPEDPDDPEPGPDDIPDKYQVGILFEADANGKLTMGTLVGRRRIIVYISLFDSAGKYSQTGQGEIEDADVPNPVADPDYAFDLWSKNGTGMTVLDKKAPADGIPFTASSAPSFMAHFDEDNNGNETPDKYEYFTVTLVAGPNGSVAGGPVVYGQSVVVIPPATPPANGVKYGDALIDYGHPIPATTADIGHYFHKWMSSADGELYSDLQVRNMAITANTTFTAIFLADANPQLPEVYEITYKIDGPGKIDGGKNPIIAFVPENNKLGSTVPVTTPDDITSEFIGWFDKNGTKVADTDADLKDIIPTADTVYTAKFAAKPTNNVKFIAGPGGTLNTPTDFDVAYDLTMNDYGYTVPTAATGTILYWYDVTTNPNIPANQITNPALIEAMTFAHDTVFVAIFDASTVIHEVTLIADTNGKLNITETQVIIYVPDGERLGNLVPSTNPDTGYRFDKWVDASGNTVDIVNKVITQDETFTAKFVPQGGGGGGGGGGDRPTLEKDDHFAYIIGYTDGNVRPSANITRAEVATILFRLLTESSRGTYWSQSNDYSDVSSGSWYNNAISTLSNAGILKGYTDGTFRPNAPVTRAELATMVSRFGNLQSNGGISFTDVSSDHWAYIYILNAASQGWVTGYPDGTFKPDQSISRAETVTLINRVLGRNKLDEDSFHEDMKVWPDNQVGAWYYNAIQEATNSHNYEAVDGGNERWTEIKAPRDWAALEKSWSTAS